MTAPRFDYEKDPAAIYRRSFQIVRAETDLSRFNADEAEVAVRLVHACGMPEIAPDLVFARCGRGGADSTCCGIPDHLRRSDGRPWRDAESAASGE